MISRNRIIEITVSLDGTAFHDWIDCNWVAFSIVTRMGSHIFGIWFGGGAYGWVSKDLIMGSFGVKRLFISPS